MQLLLYLIALLISFTTICTDTTVEQCARNVSISTKQDWQWICTSSVMFIEFWQVSARHPQPHNSTTTVLITGLLGPSHPIVSKASSPLTTAATFCNSCPITPSLHRKDINNLLFISRWEFQSSFVGYRRDIPRLMSAPVFCQRKQQRCGTLTSCLLRRCFLRIRFPFVDCLLRLIDCILT